MIKALIMVLLAICLITGFLRFGMKASALLAAAGIGTFCCFFLETNLFILFFASFVFIGLAKIFKTIITQKTDMDKYTPMNFVYSAGPALLLSAVLHYVDKLFKSGINWDFIIVCSLAVVVSDTVSSETGQSINGKTYSIINLKEVEPGTDGGISVGGTVSGLIAGILFTAVYSILYPNLSIRLQILTVTLGLAGNLLDSFLGASIQKKGFINNEQTNLISIIFTMILAMILVQNW